MICIISKQGGSNAVEENEMKSIHSPYSTQSIYELLSIFTSTLYKNQKPKNQTTNILTKSLWIRHLLILLRTSTVAGK